MVNQSSGTTHPTKQQFFFQISHKKINNVVDIVPAQNLIKSSIIKFKISLLERNFTMTKYVYPELWDAILEKCQLIGENNESEISEEMMSQMMQTYIFLDDQTPILKFRKQKSKNSSQKGLLKTDQ